MTKMVEVEIDSVRVSLMSTQRIVVLRHKDDERYLPIWVGPYEAEAITVALQGVEMVRPLTHDLLKEVFDSLQARVLRVEIVTLKEDIFYGNIVAEVNDKTVNIDSRPSDAIALAVRSHVPILVDRAVMDTAGIVPEADIQEQAPARKTRKAPPAKPAAGGGESRLSVFEDFLKKLDDKKKDGEEPPVN